MRTREFISVPRALTIFTSTLEFRLMGETLSKLFIDPATPAEGGVIEDSFFGWMQLLFLFFAYGYVLFWSSGLISAGSELLLLVPSLSGIVGSVVLPVLGAVPDGAIVLFSGLGPKDVAQQQLSVGVGALAGSTIMLLTIPWTLAVYAGRVNLGPDGKGTYKRPKGPLGQGWGKLTPPGNKSLTRTGINVNDGVKAGGYIMLITAVPYLIIQGAAFGAGCGTKDGTVCHPKTEHWFSLVGMIYCILAFFGYLYYQVKTAGNENKEAKREQVIREQIRLGALTFDAAYQDLLKEHVDATNDDNENTALLKTQKTDSQLKKSLAAFFRKYDADGNGTISRGELPKLLMDLNMSTMNSDKIFDAIDTNNDGQVDFKEFTKCFIKILLTKQQHDRNPTGKFSMTKAILARDSSFDRAVNDEVALVEEAPLDDDDNDDNDDEEEEEEVPEDLAHLSADQQMFRIKVRAAWQMIVGTFVVLLFSDPMVDVLNQIGVRMGIGSFYVAFVLAPLASNASELIASYNYALKKTRTTITISLSALTGAACMNNTFCLGIFLALVYFRGLEWQYAAETISILFVELIMVYFASKLSQNLLHSLLIIVIFPLSIVLVAGIEAAGLN